VTELKHEDQKHYMFKNHTRTYKWTRISLSSYNSWWIVVKHSIT